MIKTIVIAIFCFLAGVIWFKDRLWPYYPLEDAYVKLKYELFQKSVRTASEETSLGKASKTRDIKVAAFTVKKITNNNLDRMHDDLSTIAFSRPSGLLASSEKNNGILDHGNAGQPLDTIAAKIETFTFDMGASCRSVKWLLHPPDPQARSRKILIVQQGHRPYVTGGAEFPSSDVRPVIEKALAEGLYVGISYMPFIDPAAPCNISYDDPIVGPITIDRHSHFEYAPRFEQVFGFHPLSMFLSPLKTYVDILKDRWPSSELYMTGLSGGGWTTTVYAALDQRIDAGFAVAGSIPFSIRNNMPQDHRDYETTLIAQFGDYSDLYVMATRKGNGYARRHYLIYNVSDACCFASKHFDSLEIAQKLNQVIRKLSAKDIAEPLIKVIDINNLHHSITPATAKIIVEAIKER